MRSALLLGLGLVVSCEPVDDPCTSMCTSASALFAECLTEWQLSWEQAGFAGEEGYLENCETWAWELRLLEVDAGETGQVDAICQERADLFMDGTCEDYTAVDWNTPPWESSP